MPVSGQSSEAIQNQYLNWQILTNTHCRDLDTNKYIMNRLVCIQYKLYVLHLFWTANLDRYLLIVLAQIDLDVFESYWFHAGCVAGSPPLDALAADAAAPAAGCSSSLLPRPDIDTFFSSMLCCVVRPCLGGLAWTYDFQASANFCLAPSALWRSVI